MPNIVYKRFTVDITDANISYNKKFDLDKNIKLVKGVMVTANRPDFVYYRGSLRLTISGDEYFPEDYEARNLQSGLSVPPDDRYAELDIAAGNGEVKVLYKDVNNDLASFSPYTFVITLKCEIQQ